MSIVEVVQVVKAIQRKPKELGNVTFFGANDEWMFLQSDSPNMCEACHSYNLNSYGGSEVRGLFPELEIINENALYPHVHVNCMCSLVRVYPVEEVQLKSE